MPIEIEQKYRLTNPDAFMHRLTAQGVKLAAGIEQVDTYYAHPARDFANTDEALRLRRVDQQNHLTYKGPKLHSGRKTRREIEFPLGIGPETAELASELLEALGFQSVLEVRKIRRIGHFAWRDFQVEIALDQVDRLGDFVELELKKGDGTLDECHAALDAVADELGLADPTSTSYLEMLLENRSGS